MKTKYNMFSLTILQILKSIRYLLKKLVKFNGVYNYFTQLYRVNKYNGIEVLLPILSLHNHIISGIKPFFYYIVPNKYYSSYK